MKSEKKGSQYKDVRPNKKKGNMKTIRKRKKITFLEEIFIKNK